MSRSNDGRSWSGDRNVRDSAAGGPCVLGDGFRGGGSCDSLAVGAEPILAAKLEVVRGGVGAAAGGWVVPGRGGSACWSGRAADA